MRPNVKICITFDELETLVSAALKRAVDVVYVESDNGRGMLSLSIIDRGRREAHPIAEIPLEMLPEKLGSRL